MAPVDFNVSENSYCVVLPPRISSNGIGMPGYVTDHVLRYGLPQLEIQLISFFVTTQVCYFIFRPFKLPRFVSTLLAGIILGQTVFSRNEVVRKTLFPKFNEKESHAKEITNALEVFGYTIFLFLNGVKMDLSMLWRVGQKTWVIGFTTLMVPMFAGALTLSAYASYHIDNKMPMAFHQLSYISSQHAVTSFPVISWLLSDLKLLNTELGRLALSSSLISYFIWILFLSASSSLDASPLKAGEMVALMIAFVLLIMFVLRPAMKWVIRRTPEGRPVKDLYLHRVMFFVLVSTLATHYAGQTVLLGPLLLGLAVPDGPPLGSELVSRLKSFAEVFVAIAVTSAGADADLSMLALEVDKLPWDLSVIFIVFAAKIAGSILPPLICNIPFNDSLALALILSCRGITELGFYRFLHDQKMLDDRRYALVILTLLISAALTPVLVRLLFKNSRKLGGYQTRDVMHLKPEMELPVVACIHRHHNIEPILDLLSCLSPSHESPISVYAIHLVKLVGQGVPALISHQHHRKIVGKSYSDDVILAFTNYGRNNVGRVNVSLFTAVSPVKLMHEDVCHVALDKLCSLIILPYHCKWSSSDDGKMESEDGNVRALNVSVLQRAPCSVAILVDRGHLGEAAAKAKFHVGMFYLGGGDDREALALAKRMARDRHGTLLTVVHLCEDLGGGEAMRLEEVMEKEVLDLVVGEDDEGSMSTNNVEYRREVVKDGPQSAMLVRSMVDEFDLVVVGRRAGKECRQTSGLTDWIEVAELGALGDLLASQDLQTRASVLVVQQQQKPKPKPKPK